MTQLYTSIAHTKIALQNGGAPPPVMQFSREWRDRFDMESVLGLGALVEDPQLGLKCPFKGCPVYCHGLARHVLAMHGVSSAELKKALGLPVSLSLLSTSAREKMSKIQRDIAADGRSGIYKAIAKGRQQRAKLRGAARRRWRPKAAMSVAARNWRGSCRAQLGERLKRAIEESGAVNMTQLDAIQILGHATFKKLIRTFGSWNIAKQSLGLPVHFRMARRLDMPTVVAAFRAFEEKHGRFPTSGEAQKGHHAPLIPSYNPTLRVTGCKTWETACAVIRREIRRTEAKAA